MQLRENQLSSKNEPKVNSLALKSELDNFEAQIFELKILYEQYFSGLLPLPPTKEHDEVKRNSRSLLRMPFKNLQINFRLKNLVLRYQTLNTHWEKVLLDRENGTYSKDKFKAELRHRHIKSLKKVSTDESKKEKAIKELFTSYQDALIKNSGSTRSLNFQEFKENLEENTKYLSEKNKGKEISFRVEVEGNKVSIKAKLY